MTLRYWLVSLLLCMPAANAEVSEALDYVYYDVTARSGQRLLTILNDASPIREQGRVYHGYTKWNIRWNFWWNEERGGCRITSTKTAVTGTITLPRLGGGDAGQQSDFARYAEALKQHELGHYQIGRDAALAIDRELLALPVMGSCDALGKAANDGAYRTLDRYKEKERTYDASTQHGRSQGAWLDK